MCALDLVPYLTYMSSMNKSKQVFCASSLLKLRKKETVALSTHVAALFSKSKSGAYKWMAGQKT